MQLPSLNGVMVGPGRSPSRYAFIWYIFCCGSSGSAYSTAHFGSGHFDPYGVGQNTYRQKFAFDIQKRKSFVSIQRCIMICMLSKKFPTSPECRKNCMPGNLLHKPVGIKWPLRQGEYQWTSVSTTGDVLSTELGK